MALSGSFKTNGWYSSSKGDNVYLEFSWTATQSVASNASTISWQLRGSRTASGYVNAGGFRLVIDGEVVYNKSTDYRIELYNGTVVASGTKTITHAANGTRSFDVSMQGAIYTYAVNCWGNSTFTLNTIPRCSTLTVSNGTLKVAQDLTVKKESSGFTHTISWRCGSTSGTICTKDSRTTIPWTPSIDLAFQNPTGTNVSVTFTITTFSGNTEIGSKTATASYYIPDDIAPPLTINLSDLNGYYEMLGSFIQGESRLRVGINTYGVYGSWIKSYKTEFEGFTYTTEEVTTGVIGGKGVLNGKVTVTDSRERSCATEFSVTVAEYSPPKIKSLKATRCDKDGNASETGDHVAFKFTASRTVGEYVPEGSYRLIAKKSNETNFSPIAIKDINVAEYSETVVFAADPAYSYDIVLYVWDTFNSVDKATVAPSAKRVWSLLKKAGNIIGMAFGKSAEQEGVVDFGFKARFSGGLLHPVLQSATDLDTVKTPGTFMMLTANSYTNAPETGIGSFLEIVGIEDGSLIQRVSIFSQPNPRQYERIHYSTSGWGAWVCVRGDFVVEQGEKNGWTYRKWNSGVMECWMRVTHTAKLNVPWNSMYVCSASVPRYNYPFPFTAPPVENVTVQSGWYMGIPYADINGNGANGTYATAMYNIVSLSQVNDNVTFTLSLSVNGRWK